MIKTVEEVMNELGIDEEKALNELTDEELLKLYNACDEYIEEQCVEICKRAGLLEEWEKTDGDTFGNVLIRAVETIENENDLGA